MRFEPTALPGLVRIIPEPHRDERGFFARLHCPEELAAAGLEFSASQINLSRNPTRHTLRGLHFQEPPFAEAKIVRAIRGAIFDVAVDLRPGSPTRFSHFACRLDAEGAEALFVPEGFAHGFLTLEPETDVLYQMGRPYLPGHAKGLRWDDSALGIPWPHQPALIGPADKAWPLLERQT